MTGTDGHFAGSLAGRRITDSLSEGNRPVSGDVQFLIGIRCFGENIVRIGWALLQRCSAFQLDLGRLPSCCHFIFDFVRICDFFCAFRFQRSQFVAGCFDRISSSGNAFRRHRFFALMIRRAVHIDIPGFAVFRCGCNGIHAVIPQFRLIEFGIGNVHQYINAIVFSASAGTRPVRCKRQGGRQGDDHCHAEDDR